MGNTKHMINEVSLKFRKKKEMNLGKVHKNIVGIYVKCEKMWLIQEKTLTKKSV